MTHYVGLDVSLRSVAICMIDAEGQIRLESSADSEVESIAQVLEAFDGEIVSVGLEAGVLTQHLTYGLQAAGYEVVCMEARCEPGSQSRCPHRCDLVSSSFRLFS